VGIDIGDFMDFYFTKEEVKLERSKAITGEDGGR